MIGTQCSSILDLTVINALIILKNSTTGPENTLIGADPQIPKLGTRSLDTPSTSSTYKQQRRNNHINLETRLYYRNLLYFLSNRLKSESSNFLFLLPM